MTARAPKTAPLAARRYTVFIAMFCGFAVLAWRVVELQLSELPHLQEQGEARYLREVDVQPARGIIFDRNGQVLAMSTPVGSLTANPQEFCAAQAKWQSLVQTVAAAVDFTADELRAKCKKYAGARFMYLRRLLPMHTARAALALGVPGLGMQQEYKRYYPGGAAGAHLIGFTNLDDAGQEGLEFSHDAALRGAPGIARLLADVRGQFVETVESVQQVRHGDDLHISIDQRLQSLASEHLQAAVREHNAAGGSVVVLAVPSGEILAMVGLPQFNPNDRGTIKRGVFRNRSVTDVMEPGSTMKPFTIASALEDGTYHLDAMIDTAPGYYQVGGRTISDVHNYGELTVGDVLVKSSNVGVAKITIGSSYDDLHSTFAELGFGKRVGGLAGEAAGALQHRKRPIERVTQAYGYGLSATPLQLARAYTAFATDGVVLPVTLEKMPPGYRAFGRRVFSRETAHEIRGLLQRAASREGTAHKAQIPRYEVGGKTGTVHKLKNGRYLPNRYRSLFAGLAPVSAPKFVMVVMVDDPRGKKYGGDVAAPVFAALMQDVMRLYNIKPDAPAEEADAAGGAEETTGGGAEETAAGAEGATT